MRLSLKSDKVNHLIIYSLLMLDHLCFEIVFHLPLCFFIHRSYFLGAREWFGLIHRE